MPGPTYGFVKKTGWKLLVASGMAATLVAASGGMAAAATWSTTWNGNSPSMSMGGVTGTLYFTRFATANYPSSNYGGTGDANNVGEVSFSYAKGAFTLGTPKAVAAVPAADGVAFTPGPNSQLVVGGQWSSPTNPSDVQTSSPADVYVVNPNTGQYTAVPAGTPAAFMLGLSPNGRMAYVGSVGGGANGQLGVISLYPKVASAGTITVHGPNPNIDAIAFAGQGDIAYYTSGSPDAPGAFGTINLSTGQETQLMTNQPWAHGMVYDPYSGTLIASGMNEVAQIDPQTNTVIGMQTITLNPADAGGNSYFATFDQPWVDGHGQVFVSANNGQLAFIDYAATRRLAAPTYMTTVYLSSWLDDVVGVMSQPNACVSRDPDQNGDMHSDNHNGKGEDNGHANNDQHGTGVGQCGPMGNSGQNEMSYSGPNGMGNSGPNGMGHSGQNGMGY